MIDEPHVPFGGKKQPELCRYNGESIREEVTTTKWISIQRELREFLF